MKTSEENLSLYRFITSTLIVVFYSLSYAYAWLLYNDVIILPFYKMGNYLAFVVYFIILLSFLNAFGALKIGYLKRSDVIYSNFLALFITNFLSYFQISLIARRLINFIPIIILTAIDVLFAVIWAYSSYGIYERISKPQRLAIIYCSKNATDLVIKMSRRDDKYIICCSVDINIGLSKIKNMIINYEGIILCDISKEDRDELIKFCFENSLKAYVTPSVSDIIIKAAEEIDLFDTPLILCKRYSMTIIQRIVKRTIDIILSAFALVILSPIMVIIALLIKVYDKGPVFYTQPRCTLNAKEFKIYKFRSMVIDAEKNGKSMPAVDNDPRITPIGRVIRMLRIDELPQLINILKGDMSIVGPRPERTDHIKEFSKEIPEFKYRLNVKGGLTGYAQIIGKYNTSAYDKLRLDLMYIQNYSLLLDLKLIIMTIKILFVKESTKGFDK